MDRHAARINGCLSVSVEIQEYVFILQLYCNESSTAKLSEQVH